MDADVRDELLHTGQKPLSLHIEPHVASTLSEEEELNQRRPSQTWMTTAVCFH